MPESPSTVILQSGLELSVTEEQSWSLIQSGSATWDGETGHAARSIDDDRVVTNLMQTRSGIVCDFCNWQLNEEEEVWSYPAKDFDADRIGNIRHQSLGAWSACGLCHRLIARHDRKGVTRRSMQSFVARHPEERLNREDRRQLQAKIARMHERFYRNRTGPPTQLR